MTDRNREVAPGARAPVLSIALLARIHESNRDYVELLLAQRSILQSGLQSGLQPGTYIESVPAKVLDALELLPPASRHALAATPFALYSLGFDDPQFWSAALTDTMPDGAGESVEARYGAPGAASMQAAFCETALFLAWHAAVLNRVAARVLFALPDPLARMLVNAPLWRLRRIAMDYPELLTPRWPANPAFWPDLARFAAAGDSRRLETTQLLGNQLIAAELEGLGPRRRLNRAKLRREGGNRA